MFEKIQAMLAEALNLPREKVTMDSKIVDDLGADSLDAVELISRLEDEYNVTVADEDVENNKQTIGKSPRWRAFFFFVVAK